MKRAIIYLLSLLILLTTAGELLARGYYVRSGGFYPRSYYGFRPYYPYRPYYRPYYYPSYYYPAYYSPFYYPGYYGGGSVFYSYPGVSFRVGPWY